jgi:hypothetical protein
VTALLAAQEPYWKPGTASGYHAVTQGYLIGEVLRRITGRTLGTVFTVFTDEIAGPLGADFRIGLPAAEDHRVAGLIPPAGDPPTGTAELWSVVAENPDVDPLVTRTRPWRGRRSRPATASATPARWPGIHAILANGGVSQGRRFLSEAGCRRALEAQVAGVDLVLAVPLRFGLGFALGAGESLHWGGNGGSLALIDLQARTSIAYTPNRMANDLRGHALAMAFRG